MKSFADLILALFGIVYVLVGAPVLALAITLLVVANTLRGRLFAVGVVALVPSLFMFWLSWYVKRWHKKRCLGGATLLFLVAVALSAICYVLVPPADWQDEYSPESVFTGTAKYNRLSPANLVPELDQFRLAACLLPAMDRHMDMEQAADVRELFTDIYEEMEDSGDFSHLGSVLDLTYQDILRGKRPTGHMYVYVPESSAANIQPTPLPAILFLHGGLGNFKGYMWVWKQLADEHRFAIVAPTFGTGQWQLEGGVEQVENARQYCIEHPRIDGSRIYLAGLSNGGIGVGRAATANPDGYKGLIFISPIMEESVLRSEKFAGGWRDRRVLVLYGAFDRRISSTYVEEGVDSLRWRQVDVESQAYDADHFLFFSDPDGVTDRVAKWLEGAE